MPGRILLVEDDPLARKLFRLSLQGLGYSFDEAATGQEALLRAAEGRPDLILLDLRLPDTSGLPLASTLRARHPETAIIALSGAAMMIQQARKMSAIFSDFLLKPISPAQLVSAVRRHLPDSRAPAQRKRILLVDDDPLQLKLVRLHLESAGFRVTALSDPRAALEAASESPPDAVVSDVLMPDIDGFRLCHQLRMQPSLAQVPVVLISAHHIDAPERQHARQVGASALLQRSPGYPELIKALSSQLSTPQPAAGPITAATGHMIRKLDRQASHSQKLLRSTAIQSAQLATLAHVAEGITSGSDLTEVLNGALQHSVQAEIMEWGAIFLLDKQRLSLRALAGCSPVQRDVLASLRGELSALLCDHDDAVRCLPPAPWMAALGSGTVLLAPLVAAGQQVGMLLMASSRADFSEYGLTFARALRSPLTLAATLVRTISELSASEARFRTIASTLPRGLLSSDSQGIIRYANPAAEELLGVDAAALRGQPIVSLLRGESEELLWQRGEEQVLLQLQKVAHHNSATWLLTDITDHRQTLHRLQNEASRDALTGLLNRRHFLRSADALLSTLQQQGRSAVVAFIDLDRFKQVNDQLGHHEGDALLRRTAQALQRQLREDTLLARIGGDEFAVLLPDVTLSQSQRLRDRLREAMLSAMQDTPAGASVGLAAFPDHGHDIERLLEEADARMYEDKQDRRLAG